MTNEELMLILLDGNKAFQYAREHLSSQLEDASRAEQTQQALMGPL